MKEKLVFSSIDNLEVEYICSVLKDNNIPFIKKTEGAGEYFAIATGNTFNNAIKIFVNDEDYQKAYELIGEINKPNEPISILEIPEELKNITPEEEKEMEETSKKTKRSLKRLVKYVLFYPSLFVIIYSIIMSILQNYLK